MAGKIANPLSGMFGNLSEITPEKLMEKFGKFLMDGEEIHAGFVLIRDAMIFTNKRIINIDKQGATGIKARVTSIYLSSIINVSVETAGFGIEDSEITIDYISSPYFRANGGVSLEKKSFEFPKKYDIQSLYRWLQETAYANHLSINK